MSISDIQASTETITDNTSTAEAFSIDPVDASFEYIVNNVVTSDAFKVANDSLSKQQMILDLINGDVESMPESFMNLTPAKKINLARKVWSSRYELGIGFIKREISIEVLVVNKVMDSIVVDENNKPKFELDPRWRKLLDATKVGLLEKDLEAYADAFLSLRRDIKKLENISPEQQGFVISILRERVGDAFKEYMTDSFTEHNYNRATGEDLIGSYLDTVLKSRYREASKAFGYLLTDPLLEGKNETGYVGILPKIEQSLNDERFGPLSHYGFRNKVARVSAKKGSPDLSVQITDKEELEPRAA